MKKHVKIYMQFFDYGEQDYIPSECNHGRCNDIHHIKFRSQGGKDEIENLIGLCRECHIKAHKDSEFNEYLKELHMQNIENQSVMF